MKRMWLWIFIAVVGVGLLVAGCQATRAGYESAPYKVVRSDGKFELRDYPALTVVETPMASPNGSDGSFMRLFRFITGSNEGKQKIAMTTPVFMSGSESNATMAFVMPAKLKADTVPKPSDGAVTVRELPPGRFAVLRFSGGRSAKKEAESLAQLKAWMETEKLGVLSSPVYGYFDPPWTPAFLRRNEVMLRTGRQSPNEHVFSTPKPPAGRATCCCGAGGIVPVGVAAAIAARGRSDDGGGDDHGGMIKMMTVPSADVQKGNSGTAPGCRQGFQPLRHFHHTVKVVILVK